MNVPRGAARSVTGLLLLVGAVAGCAKRVTPGHVAADQITIEIQNDLVPRRGVTVRLVSEAGTRLILGSVSPGQTRSLSLRREGLRGAYHFTASRDGGSRGASADLSSTKVALAPGSTTVFWRLSTNFLTVTEATDPVVQHP